MKRTSIIMGMPVTVEVTDRHSSKDIDSVFEYFVSVDARYSTYKKNSEISQINRGLPTEKWSSEMTSVLKLCEETKEITGGYFDIERDGKKDPSGLVKGWAIHNAADLLRELGHENFYIEAGGDIEVSGVDTNGEPWKIGIRNPFNIEEIIKIVQLQNAGIATSGLYIRGEHIYNPVDNDSTLNEIKSLTVIGPNIFEADRFATAAFAMGRRGISFLSMLPGFDAYMVDDKKQATYTKGFENYVV